MPTLSKHRDRLTNTRTSPRLSIRCSGIFAGDYIEGEGTAVNISVGGAKIVSAQGVPEGTHLSLRLYLLDAEQPLDVELARVRWTAAREFGVQFLRLQPQAQARLKSLFDLTSP